ncbi:MAG TPA: helicase, partial [Rubrivivax sp.]|nr:helicase [Rubrivivax sp.]
MQIDAESLERIRQSAYLLPQVVKPADYVAEHSPGFESHLDKLGLVQLQKAAPGGRPSRWIEPALMASALAQLDAVGIGPEVRPLMLERTAALQKLGIVREAGVFKRLAQQNIHVAVPDAPPWSVAVAFELTLDPAPLWDFYRTGDVAALQAALGADPTHPHAGAVASHLQTLVARSHAFQPRHLETLLPRLQAECALPQPLAQLLAATTRVQDRWEHRATELDLLS